MGFMGEISTCLPAKGSAARAQEIRLQAAGALYKLSVRDSARRMGWRDEVGEGAIQEMTKS